MVLKSSEFLSCKKSELSKSVLLLLQTWPGKGVLILLATGFVPQWEHDPKCYRKDLSTNSICQICGALVRPAECVGSMQGVFDAVLAEHLKKIPLPESFIAAWLN